MPGDSLSDMHFGAHILNYADTKFSRNILKSSPWELQHNSFPHEPDHSGRRMTTTNSLKCGEPDVVKMIIDMLLGFSSELFEGVQSEKAVRFDQHPCCSYSSFKLTNWATRELCGDESESEGTVHVNVGSSSSSSSVGKMLLWFLEFGNELLCCRKFKHDCVGALAVQSGFSSDGSSRTLSVDRVCEPHSHSPPLFKPYMDLISSCSVEIVRILQLFDQEVSAFEETLLSRRSTATDHIDSRSGVDRVSGDFKKSYASLSYSISMVKLYNLCYKHKPMIHHQRGMLTTLSNMAEHMQLQLDLSQSQLPVRLTDDEGVMNYSSLALTEARSTSSSAVVPNVLNYMFISQLERHVQTVLLLSAGGGGLKRERSINCTTAMGIGTTTAGVRDEVEVITQYGSMSFQGLSLKFSCYPTAMVESGQLLLSRIMSTSLYRSLIVPSQNGRIGVGTGTGIADGRGESLGILSSSSSYLSAAASLVQRVLYVLNNGSNGSGISSSFARQLHVSNYTISTAMKSRGSLSGSGLSQGTEGEGRVNLGAVLNRCLNTATGDFIDYLSVGGSIPSSMVTLSDSNSSRKTQKPAVSFVENTLNNKKLASEHRRQRKSILLGRVFGTATASVEKASKELVSATAIGISAVADEETSLRIRTDRMHKRFDFDSLAESRWGSSSLTLCRSNYRRVKFQMFQHLCPLATQTRVLLQDSVQAAIAQHNSQVLSNLVEYYQVEMFLRTVVKGIYWFGESGQLCHCLSNYFESVATYQQLITETLLHDATTDSLLGFNQSGDGFFNGENENDISVTADTHIGAVDATGDVATYVPLRHGFSYDSVCEMIAKLYDLFVVDVLAPMNLYYSRLAAECSQQCHSLVILQLVLPALVLPTRDQAERTLVSPDKHDYDNINGDRTEYRQENVAETALEYVIENFVSHCSVQLYANYPFSLLLGRGAGVGAQASVQGTIKEPSRSSSSSGSHVDALNCNFQYLLSLHLLKMQLELRWIHANKPGNSQSYRRGDRSRGEERGRGEGGSGNGNKTKEKKGSTATGATNTHVHTQESMRASVSGVHVPAHRIIPTSQRVMLYLLLQYVNHIANCVLVNIHDGRSSMNLWPVLRTLSSASTAADHSSTGNGVAASTTGTATRAAVSMSVGGVHVGIAATADLPSSIDEFTWLVTDCVRAVDDSICGPHGYNADIKTVLHQGWRAVCCGDNPDLSETQRSEVFDACYAALIALYNNLTVRHNFNNMLRSVSVERNNNLGTGIGEDLLAILPQVA